MKTRTISAGQTGQLNSICHFQAARWITASILSGLLCLGMLSPALAERSVTLAWNPSESTGVTGYYVYALEENSVTPVRINAGNTNQTTITSLKEGLRYSFTVVAYDAAGTESEPSNEALFVVPVPLSMISAASPGGLWRVQFQGAPGRSYELQATTDLKNWSTIWQSGPVTSYAPLEFADPDSAVLGARFYRLRVF